MALKKTNSRRLLNYNKLRQFLKLNKKRIALICFIEITSILAHPKTQLNQAVKPYSINVVTFVKEAASNFLL